MRTFRSMQELRSADVDTLASIPEIPRREAQQIYDYFHQDNGR